MVPAAGAPDCEELLDRTLKGDRVAAARLISAIENHEAPASVLKRLHRAAGKAAIVGVTGPPGAGKSTLVDRLTDHYRKQGKEIGVVAVDPSSPFTGGAFLGDRIRMQSRSTDPKVFVRSMGTRGALGGLASTTNEVVKVLDAMGKDIVFVETVGVGQGEVDIVRTADTVVVVLVPGMGDAIQTIKAGILEIGDVFCVNKGDRPETPQTMAELASMLEMGPKREWQVPIVRTVAVKDEGLSDLAKAIEGHRAQMETSGELKVRRRRRAEAELLDVLQSWIVSFVYNDGKIDARFRDYVEAIASRRRDPHDVAREILGQAKLPATKR